MEAAGAEVCTKTDQLRQGIREHGEVTMEAFIKHQMMVILQPLMDHIQDLDAGLSQLGERVSRTETSAANDRAVAERFKADLLDLRTELKKSNAQVTSSHERVDACMRRDEELLQGMENSNGFVQRIHDQVQETDRLVLQLQRELGELDCESQALRAQLQRTSDNVTNDVGRTLEVLSADVKGMKATHTTTTGDILQLKQNLENNGELLRETRQGLDKSKLGAAELRKSLDDLSTKEGQLSSKLEGWKSQWSKLHPALDALRKDTSFLKQGYEHHDQVICSLQQGYSTTFSGLEDARNTQGRTQGEVTSLQEEMCTTKRGLGEITDRLEKTASFANSLHTAQQRMHQELQMAGTKLDGIDSKHSALCDGVEKTNNNVSDLMQEHRKSATNVQVLQHEVEKTFEALQNTRGQLEGTNAELSGVKGELSRTGAAVQKLDHGVESCRASFSGMQRGFMETGSQLSSRALNLPRLPPSGLPPCSPPSPRVVVAAAERLAARDKGAEGSGDRRDSAAYTAATSDGASTSAASSRRSSICTDLASGNVTARSSIAR